MAKRFSGSGFAAAAECHAVFFICTHCDRGQRYCSAACRGQARRQQHGARQQPPPAEPRRTARSSRPAARVPVPPGPRRVTDQGSLSITSPASFECGKPVTMPAVAPLRVRPLSSEYVWLRCRICGRERTIRRSVSTHSTQVSETSHDQSGNPRADSPLLLRRALEDRHHCQ